MNEYFLNEENNIIERNEEQHEIIDDEDNYLLDNEDYIADDDNDEDNEKQEVINESITDDDIMSKYMSQEELDKFNESNEEAIKYLRSNPDISEEMKSLLWDDLAKKNFNLVYRIANDTPRAFVIGDLQEIIAAGMLGYAKAFNAYNPNKLNSSGKPNKFATLAFHCIRNEIRFAIRKESKHFKNDESINNVKYTDKDGSEIKVEDLIKDDRPTIAEQETENAFKAMVRESLNGLSPIEKYVMWTRYGLDGDEMTQKDIAKIVDMSQANVSKIERGCLERLRDVVNEWL